MQLPGKSHYDGIPLAELARIMNVPGVFSFGEISSTMDIAHQLVAENAPGGTVVLAESQSKGRGRNGRAWSSDAGQGIWLTVIERPQSRAALEVLSLRVGLNLASVLDKFASDKIQLKWPNDLYLDDRKLGGILIEARWRDNRAESVSIGVGINIVAPDDQPNAIGLNPGTRRIDVLAEIVPALRQAAAVNGPLSAEELAVYGQRDFALGKRCTSPANGVVQGISSSGELLVELRESADTDSAEKQTGGVSRIVAERSGSLILDKQIPD